MRQEIPYIGITGVATKDEARSLAAIYRDTFANITSHHPATGYLVSSDTLHGKYGKNKKYPPITELAEFLDITGEKSVNVIHFWTPNKLDLASEVSDLLKKDEIYDSKRSQVLQLNIRQPDPAQMRLIKKSFPDIKFIYQVGRGTMSVMSSGEIAQHIFNNKEVADYVLIDPSGGRGLEFEPEDVSSYFCAVKEAMPDMPVMFAGGFSGDNVRCRLREIQQIIETKDFGVDAESGLRKATETNLTGELSKERVKEYLGEVVSFFNQTF